MKRRTFFKSLFGAVAGLALSQCIALKPMELAVKPFSIVKTFIISGPRYGMKTGHVAQLIDDAKKDLWDEMGRLGIRESHQLVWMHDATQAGDDFIKYRLEARFSDGPCPETSSDYLRLVEKFGI
jgi:hypothetical protein